MATFSATTRRSLISRAFEQGEFQLANVGRNLVQHPDLLHEGCSYQEGVRRHVKCDVRAREPLLEFSGWRLAVAILREQLCGLLGILVDKVGRSTHFAVEGLNEARILVVEGFGRVDAVERASPECFIGLENDVAAGGDFLLLEWRRAEVKAELAGGQGLNAEGMRNSDDVRVK